VIAAPRIALDGRVVTPHFPGIGRYVLELAKALPALPSPPAVTVLATPEQLARNALSELQGLENLRLQAVAAPVFAPSAQWRVPRALRAAGIDLYHATYWITPVWPGRPTVLSVYDLIGLRVPGSLPTGRAVALRLALRIALRSARRVLTLSEWSRGDLVRTLGVAADRVVVTPLAAGDAFRPLGPGAVEAARARLGLPARYVLYVGINKPHKNVAMLVRAWGRLLGGAASTTQPAPPAALVIAGPWDPRYEAPARAAEALPPGVVRFLGPVSEGDLPALYAGAVAFAFPSRHEGFGLPPLEAMACGTPVIAANATSLPEVVGAAGLLLDPDDEAAWAEAMARLMGDPALRARLSSAALEQAGRFSWQRTASDTRAAYAAALAPT
jgi:glycosyltransferase involved in cell wall biosynthesis